MDAIFSLEKATLVCVREIFRVPLYVKTSPPRGSNHEIATDTGKSTLLKEWGVGYIIHIEEYR